MKLSARQIAALIKVHPGPWNTKALQVRAVATAMAESGGDTKVQDYAHSGHWGLFQIGLETHWDKIPGRTRSQKLAYITTATGNILVAQKVYREAGGWSPWTASASAIGSHLGEAANAVGGISQAELGDIIKGMGTAGGDALGLGGVRDAAGAVLSPLEGISAAISWIVDPHNWLRLATFVGGLAVLLVVGASLLRQTSLGSAALGAATKGAVS